MDTPHQGSEAVSSADAPWDPRRTLTAIGTVVYDWDMVSDRIGWGPNAADLFGRPIDELWPTGRDFADAVEATDGATRAEAIGGSSLRDHGTGAPFAALYGLRLGDGRDVVVDDAGRWFADEAGCPARAHGIMRLRHNREDHRFGREIRVGFLAQAGIDIADSVGSKRPLTMFALAVGNLAELNDSFGYEAADRAIESVLGRLYATMRTRDRFARYSGNRYALLLRGCGPAEAEVAAERLARLCSEDPVATVGGSTEIRLVIGGASAPDHAQDAPTLLRRAEASLALAKRRSGAAFVMHDPRLFRGVTRAGRTPAAPDGIESLNTRRIVLACQPVLHARTREVAFREALLRIEGENGRVRAAGDIVPALERAGLVHLADIRMLELVADHLAANPDRHLSLNVSPATIERVDWPATLAGHLGARPGIAERLIVEVTETAAIRNPAETRRLLGDVKALGIRIAIDDFGAGHTSFRYMRDFPVDLVKIDGAFVQNLARSADDRFFVRTLIDLARHLGLQTVGEWVEDEESAAMLTEWGIDYLQGDHCGRPELVQDAGGIAPPATSLVA